MTDKDNYQRYKKGAEFLKQPISNLSVRCKCGCMKIFFLAARMEHRNLLRQHNQVLVLEDGLLVVIQALVHEHRHLLLNGRLVYILRLWQLIGLEELEVLVHVLPELDALEVLAVDFLENQSFGFEKVLDEFFDLVLKVLVHLAPVVVVRLLELLSSGD
jgi:hypothetical protein